VAEKSQRNGAAATLHAVLRTLVTFGSRFDESAEMNQRRCVHLSTHLSDDSATAKFRIQQVA
jgi:hypothetical protein